MLPRRTDFHKSHSKFAEAIKLRHLSSQLAAAFYEPGHCYLKVLLLQCPIFTIATSPNHFEAG
jgi:hypothetical protein